MNFHFMLPLTLKLLSKRVVTVVVTANSTCPHAHTNVTDRTDYADA